MTHALLATDGFALAIGLFILFAWGALLDVRVGRGATALVLWLGALAAGLATAATEEFSAVPLTGLRGPVLAVTGALLVVAPKLPALRSEAWTDGGFRVPLAAPLLAMAAFFLLLDYGQIGADPAAHYAPGVDRGLRIGLAAYPAALAVGVAAGLVLRRRPPRPDWARCERHVRVRSADGS